MVNFPTITVCPDYQVAYNTTFLAKYNLTAHDMRSLNFPRISDISTFDLYVKSTYELHELLKEMYIVTNTPENGYSRFKFSGMNITQNLSKDEMEIHYNEKDWKTQYYNVFGRCYSYTLPEAIKKQRVRDTDCIKLLITYIHCIS